MGGNLIVHGDDPNTAVIDGAHGEIIWKTNIDGQAIVLFTSYGSYGLDNILGNNEYTQRCILDYWFSIAIEGCMDPGYMGMTLLQMLKMDHVLCYLVKLMQMLLVISIT